MNSSNNFLIAKFGNKNHLEQLQNGNIFFNSIQAYRNDGTDYRGDSMEGKIPINPTDIKIFNSEGKNIFETLPYPDIAIESILDDENLMMFCAAMINIEILDNVKNNKWHFKDIFKSSIKDFGDYVLLLWSTELLDHIKSSTDLNKQKIVYDSRPILYRNLYDFDNTEEYRTTGSWIDRYFVKGLSYKNQNEWRIIIDGEKEPLKANCGNGFLLQTSPFKYSTLMKTTELLNGEIEIKN
ncbi:hypothetical protein B5E58_00480 [Tyzzerella sp. An114]|uniref:hypothetical protein n=1 Tax=Tyzzerella sp. An114 TaxID=1965545 RepID=UPI000B4348C3|nr:hypothetical protein [Tyzzerella sp. An114]OUQ60379.1 hypothetical protein B5E58_00480 [Tyzzerella sp. An114]